MNDLTSLHEMRAEVPEPGADRLAPARDRLLKAATEPTRSSRLAVHRLGRRALLAGAVGAAVAATLVVVRQDPEPPAGERITHAQVRLVGTGEALEKAAKVAEARRPITSTPRPDQWQYRKSLSRQADGSTQEWESWIRYDGGAIADYHSVKGTFEIRRTEPDPGDDDLSPQQYDRRLRGLPTDPDKLLAKVRGDRHWVDYPVEERHLKEPPDDRAFRVISLYLSQRAVMPPKLEAALYRALAKIPGVIAEEGVQDGAGRPGLALSRTTNNLGDTREHVILDPKTFRYLGSRSVTRSDVRHADGSMITKAGDVFSTAELAWGIVDKAGQRP